METTIMGYIGVLLRLYWGYRVYWARLKGLQPCTHGMDVKMCLTLAKRSGFAVDLTTRNLGNDKVVMVLRSCKLIVSSEEIFKDSSVARGKERVVHADSQDSKTFEHKMH